MTREERAERRAAMREYKAQGHTNIEVAEKFGATEGYAVQVCKGICPQKSKAVPKNKGILKPENEVSLDIKRRLPEFEYAGNYTGTEGRVDLRCKTCGAVSNWSMITVRHNKARCPNCKELARQEAENEKNAQKIFIKECKRLERERRRAEELQRKAERRPIAHECAVCGKMTTRPKYCCDECSKKAFNSSHEHRRRVRIKSAMVDNDITLEGLFKRDRGICWICGDKCNYEDYIISDKAFIAGDWYPSIDHVIELANGGEHSWNNVKLAHRICNTKRFRRNTSPAV